MTNSNETKGPKIVYVLTNDAMPKYVKIGKTKELPSRLKQLDTTPVPLPFKCVYAIQMRNAAQTKKLEEYLHDAFSDNRVRKGREFFEIDYERVVSALKIAKIIGGKDVTPTEIIAKDEEGKQAAEKKERRTIAAAFSFDKVGIEKGAQLQFKTQRKITATVIDTVRTKIECPEVPGVSSLSATAKILLGFRHGPQGPAYWMYKDPERGLETLSDRRDRLEQDEDM